MRRVLFVTAVVEDGDAKDIAAVEREDVIFLIAGIERAADHDVPPYLLPSV